jgi:hypothetical protein
MKCIFKFLLIIWSFGFSFIELAYSQAADSVYDELDIAPNFKYKAYDDLHKKINDYFRANSRLKILGIGEVTAAYKGVVLLNFIVEMDGSLSNIEIKSYGFNPDINELIGILLKTGIWTPGYVKGKAVRSSLIFPFYVNLEQ